VRAYAHPELAESLLTTMQRLSTTLPGLGTKCDQIQFKGRGKALLTSLHATLIGRSPGISVRPSCLVARYLRLKNRYFIGKQNIDIYRSIDIIAQP